MKGSENLNCAPSRLCWGQQRLRLSTAERSARGLRPGIGKSDGEG